MRHTHPTARTGIADLAEAAERLAASTDTNLSRLGDAIKQYLDGAGSLDEAVQLEFGIRDNNERFEVARARRNHVLAVAATHLSPGSHRGHAREMLRLASGTIPQSAERELVTAIQALRERPLSLNQLEDILKHHPACGAVTGRRRR